MHTTDQVERGLASQFVNLAKIALIAGSKLRQVALIHPLGCALANHPL